MSNCKLILLICALSLTACATKTISQGASQVQVHKQGSSLLGDCKKLGPVSGYGTKPLGNAIGSTGAIQEAIGELREATYNLLGDSVAVVNKEESVSSVRMLGVAYKCF